MSTWYNVQVLGLEVLNLQHAIANAAVLEIDPIASDAILKRQFDPAAGVARLLLRIELAHPDASTPDMDPLFVTRLLSGFRDAPFTSLYPDLWNDSHGGHIGHHNAVLLTYEQECNDTFSLCVVFVPAQLVSEMRVGTQWESAAWTSTHLFPRRFPSGRGLLAAEPREYLPLPDHESDMGGFASLAFSPDSTRLAAVSFDGQLRVWDVVHGNELHASSDLEANWNHEVAWAGGMLVISLVNNDVQVRDDQSFSPLFSLRSWSRAVQTLSSDCVLLMGSTTIERLDLSRRSIEDLRTSPLGEDLCFDRFATTNGLLAAHGTDFEMTGKEHARIWVWDLTSGETLCEINAGQGSSEAFGLCVAGEPSTVYVTIERKLHAWNARTGEAVMVPAVEHVSLGPVCSADGRFLLLVTSNPTVWGFKRADGTSYRHSDTLWLYSIESRRMMRALPIRAAEAQGFAVSPDGRTIAVATSREVILYRVPEDL